MGQWSLPISGKEQEIGSDELISKWGSQDKEDPTTINWTIRLNYARKTLNYVKIIDEMSENQKLVDDYMVINYVDSVTPLIDKGSAMELVKSISKSDHGFEIKMDRLDRMIYVWYKTKLVNAVKDSTNPTNKVELKAEDSGAISKSHAVLVGEKVMLSERTNQNQHLKFLKNLQRLKFLNFKVASLAFLKYEKSQNTQNLLAQFPMKLLYMKSLSGKEVQFL